MRQDVGVCGRYSELFNRVQLADAESTSDDAKTQAEKGVDEKEMAPSILLI